MSPRHPILHYTLHIIGVYYNCEHSTSSTLKTCLLLWTYDIFATPVITRDFMPLLTNENMRTSATPDITLQLTWDFVPFPATVTVLFLESHKSLDPPGDL
jgi:hypothetical protein